MASKNNNFNLTILRILEAQELYCMELLLILNKLIKLKIKQL